ncbi:MAG: cobyrinic acid ac-diamide synthase [Chloroflexi bacterium]|nr:cobyrinic acid ac-diamide synthase [Chloroflexota bacterium]
MKLAISGKGGVGKTTLTSLLAYTFVNQNFNVLAIDADPSPCLGDALGFPRELIQGLTPIAEMGDLIAERTGAKPGTFGGIFKMNPRVDDIPDRFSATHRGIRLLELGAVKMGGAGCICAESVLLKQLVTIILLQRNEVVLMDLYAGVEHLGRATSDMVDALLIVAEPTARSLGTAAQIKQLATDIKIPQLYLVGSKIASPADRDFIAENSPGLPVIGFLSADPAVLRADRERAPVYDLSPTLVTETKAIVDALQSDAR